MRRLSRRAAQPAVCGHMSASLPLCRAWQTDITPRHIVRVPDPSVAKFEGETRREWCDEPSLADVDRSVAQVDCPFLAELVARRLKAREGLIDSATEKRRTAMEARVKRDVEDGVGAAAGAASPVPSAVALDKQADEADGVFPWRDEYDDGFLLIDCRTVSECTSWGMVEGAKVIPAHELWDALQLQPEAFEEFYGFAKPGKDNVTLLFYCQYGPRSLMAAQIASYLGYQSIVHLRDGYYEWAKQFNKLCRRFQVHDLESGNEHRRATEVHVARGLAHDIAPEFNGAVAAEADELNIAVDRSDGAVALAVPARVEALQEEIAAADDESGDARRARWLSGAAIGEDRGGGDGDEGPTPEIATGIPRSHRSAADIAEMEATSNAKPRLGVLGQLLFKGSSLDPRRGGRVGEEARAKARVDMIDEQMRNKVKFKRKTSTGTY